MKERENMMSRQKRQEKLEIEECLSLMLERVKPQKEVCEVPIIMACGMVSARDVISNRMVPPFSKSAMDGYAVCAMDLVGASFANPVNLRVKGELLAGDYEEYIYEKNTAIRVMTGAFLPEGYDAVVRQEDTDYGEEAVQVYTQVKPFTNYCNAGEDIKCGQVIVHQNTRLQPVHIGLLASIGMEKVVVYKPIKVAVLSTGTELTEVGQPLGRGKIYNNIAYLLAAAMQQEGIQINFMQNCADEENSLACKLAEALGTADMVITTGGVSVGKKDIVPKVLADMGADILFRRADIQPGTPTTASVLKDKLILSLSGNPYAAYANFELYFWKLLAKMMHHESFNVAMGTAILQSEYPKINRCRRLIRAREEHGNVYLPTQVHASSVIHNLTDCNCFIDLEADRKVSVGDRVTIRYIKGYL